MKEKDASLGGQKVGLASLGEHSPKLVGMVVCVEFLGVFGNLPKFLKHSLGILLGSGHSCLLSIGLADSNAEMARRLILDCLDLRVNTSLRFGSRLLGQEAQMMIRQGVRRDMTVVE